MLLGSFCIFIIIKRSFFLCVAEKSYNDGTNIVYWRLFSTSTMILLIFFTFNNFFVRSFVCVCVCSKSCKFWGQLVKRRIGREFGGYKNSQGFYLSFSNIFLFTHGRQLRASCIRASSLVEVLDTIQLGSLHQTPFLSPFALMLNTLNTLRSQSLSPLRDPKKSKNISVWWVKFSFISSHLPVDM